MFGILKSQNCLTISEKKKKVDYSTYTTFALLNILWETREQVHALDALIQTDNSDVWRQQRRTCFQNTDELRRVLREKLIPELPPMVPLMLRYRNMKIVYSPRLHNEASYFRYLLSKRRVVERHQVIIDRHNELRRQRRQRQVTMFTRRGCPRW